MTQWIIPIVFLILPFALITPGLIWKSQLMFFIVCPVFIVAMNIKNVWVRYFLLYAATWQIVIFILNFKSPGANGPGLSIMLSLMAGGIVYKFISESTLPTQTWHSVIRAAVIVQILLSIPQIFGFNPVMAFTGLFTNVKENMPGFLNGSIGNRNFLAAFIAMAVPSFIGWRTITIRGLTINPALIAILIFLGFCLSPGTLAAIIGMGFLLSARFPLWKRIVSLSIAVTLAVIFAAGYVLISGHHISEFENLPGQLNEFVSTGTIKLDIFRGDVGRFAMWLVAIGQLLKSWNFMIFGYGPAASWGREYPIHCEYISVWYQFGLIGLTLMLGYIYTTTRFLFKAKNLILLTALLILCLDMIGNFPLEIATTGFMALIIGGLIERERLQWQTT